jgi:NAD(P)-dependent dehydrogenase (short-subunit alcohol dehydrogenase family)
MKNKYTLITGASSGMGALCTIQLSKSRNIILASENYVMLELVKSKCFEPEKHLVWCCDFGKERAEIYNSLSELIKNKNLEIDTYIHFAGVTQILPLKNFLIPNVDKIFNINFFSIIEILRVLLKKPNKGILNQIILISALVSIRGDIGNSIYAASKGAINSLVYSLAQELAPKIRINSILPGAIMSPMTEKSDPLYIEKLNQETPLGIGSMEDVVNYIEFLLSDKAKWITGQNIIIDGGRSTK